MFFFCTIILLIWNKNILTKKFLPIQSTILSIGQVRFAGFRIYITTVIDRWCITDAIFVKNTISCQPRLFLIYQSAWPRLRRAAHKSTHFVMSCFISRLIYDVREVKRSLNIKVALHPLISSSCGSLYKKLRRRIGDPGSV